jgi:D-glycero-alpha-D-manno-heptose-7-phosphate kinase
MIIARSPLRVTLGGGGTDLPSYYEKFGGFLIAAAIDKYVYITLHDTFVPDLIVKYSELERVPNATQLKHPIIREAFSLVGVGGESLELTSMADIPAGTGLGSSGSFTTSLLKALHAHKRNLVHPAELAAQACEIELGRLKEPIGKQDQYISAYGGITCFKFLQNGTVEAWPLQLSRGTRDRLEDNLLLFFTGYSRNASAILQEQDQKSKSDNQEMIENLHFVKDLGLQSQKALESGDLPEFARLMDVHWRRKKQRSGSMSNPKIDEWYELAMANGALGGKLIGAGGGGFLMFYAEEKNTLRQAMTKAGLQEVRFRFDFEGTKLVIS